VTGDGRRAVSASDDRTLRVWDLESGRLLVKLAGHVDEVSGCVVMGDGRRLISTSADKTLKIWDLESGRLMATLEGHARAVGACALSPDGRRVISASTDRTLKVWDLEALRTQTDLDGHTDWVGACVATLDGRRAVSASDDKTLKVWDLQTGRTLSTLSGHVAEVSGCAVTPDGGRVISTSHDQTVKVWELVSGRTLATFEGADHGVGACAVSADGSRAISASHDQTLKVWELASGRALATFEGHAYEVSSCAVTPDGRRAVSTSWDKTLRVWDVQSGRELRKLEGHTFAVNACAVTQDGQRVISASWDKTLRVWDLESGRMEGVLVGHRDRVNTCAVTLDGRRIVSASYDHTLKVWDLESGAYLFTHRGNAGFSAVAVTASSIVAGDATGAVWFLDWPPGYLAAQSASADANADKAFPPANPGVATVRADGTSPTHALFVVHAEVAAEAAFVRGELLPALQLPPEQVQLSSALPLGETIIGALEKAVASSRITVLVLTPTFLRDKWASFGETLASFAAVSGGTLVPLVLVDCQLPQRLDLRVRLDCRDPTARPEAFRRLRELISSPRSGAMAGIDVHAVEDGRAVSPPSRAGASAPVVPKLAEAAPMKHTILFLAANPLGTDPLALDREARAIQSELERSGLRDRFEFVTRLAAEPMDLLRELRKLKPTIVHFSGHGGRAGHGDRDPDEQRGARVVRGPDARRDASPPDLRDDAQYGLYFQAADGTPQFVSGRALEATFGAAGASVKLVVLSACYSELQSEALLPHIGCVVGMRGFVLDAAARTFAVGFYGGLGEGESIAAAFKQGCAAISLEGLADDSRPQLAVRSGLDAGAVVLAGRGYHQP
jgi:WD40 repeat protein